MNKKICYILFSIVLLAKTSAFCYPPPEHEYFKQPQPKQEKEIDKLAKRLEFFGFKKV